MRNVSPLRSQRAFSRFELALVTSIVAVLSTLFMYRLLDLMLEQERVRLLRVEASIQSALGLELSRRAVARELDTLGDLDAINPLLLLEESPPNYLGEIADPGLQDLPSGAWVFDTATRTLIYTIKHSNKFHSSLPGRARAEYQVKLQYMDTNRNGRFDYRIDRLAGLGLISIGTYHWRRD